MEKGMPRLRTHPGEVLAEEYLQPLGLSARALAQATGVPANRISDIIRKRRDVSADTAIRLGRFFAVDPRFWLNLQTAYDLSVAECEHDYSSVRPRSEAPAGRDTR
jgi:addiction module HigA family antidote